MLDPNLRNIIYDGVLNLLVPAGTKVVGFADNISVLTVAKAINDKEVATNEAVRQIGGKPQPTGLELVNHKTEAALITGTN